MSISRMNLQKKAVIILGCILFFVIGINTVVVTYVAYGRYKSAILSKSSAVGEGLQKEMGKVLGLGVPIGSLEGINDKLADLVSRDKAIGYAMVIDPAGKILYHNNPDNVGKELKESEKPKSFQAGEVLIQKADSYYNISLGLLNPEGKIAGILRLGIETNAIDRQLYVLLLWALMTSTICFLLSMALLHFFISRFITQRIIAMEKAADKIASGDLTITIDVRGDDELASLGKAINGMALNLKNMISKISNITKSISGATSKIVSSSQGLLTVSDVQKTAIEDTAESVESMDNSISQVASSSGILSESANDTSSSIIEMTASIEKIAENANTFSETAHDAASSIEEMVTTINEIAASIENLSQSSEAIASSIDEVNATTRDIERNAAESVNRAEAVSSNASDKGIKAATAAMEGMENIKKSVGALSEVINMLGKRTTDIGKILTVIDDVADQTNLLALNAAILASKAGEHGKGFTIVADEIKNLAERASVSTSEIAGLIKSVQDVTKSSIQMASDGIQTVERGLLLVKDVNEALSDILESSRTSTEMAKSIQRATTEEASVLKLITDSVERMTEQTENISRAVQEQSKGSKLIIEATEKVKDLSRQVKTSTGEQKDGSRQIMEVIENVRHQASQIADSTGKQKEKSINIVQSMEKIRLSTEKLVLSSNEMNDVVNSLKNDASFLVELIQKFKV